MVLRWKAMIVLSGDGRSCDKKRTKGEDGMMIRPLFFFDKKFFIYFLLFFFLLARRFVADLCVQR